MLISRNHPTAPPQIFKTPPISALHHANAYEDGLGRIVLDTLEYTVRQSKFCGCLASIRIQRV